MATLYKLFKAHGRQTDRTGYSIWLIEINYHAYNNSYSINY